MPGCLCFRIACREQCILQPSRLVEEDAQWVDFPSCTCLHDFLKAAQQQTCKVFALSMQCLSHLRTHFGFYLLAQASREVIAHQLI